MRCKSVTGSVLKKNAIILVRFIIMFATFFLDHPLNSVERIRLKHELMTVLR